MKDRLGHGSNKVGAVTRDEATYGWLSEAEVRKHLEHNLLAKNKIVGESDQKTGANPDHMSKVVKKVT